MECPFVNIFSLINIRSRNSYNGLKFFLKEGVLHEKNLRKITRMMAISEMNIFRGKFSPTIKYLKLNTANQRKTQVNSNQQ